MNIEICHMTISDLNEISDCLENDFDDFWNSHILKSEFANTNSSYYIAKSDGEIIGFAGIWRSVDDVHITNIVSRKDKRNQKVASTLLERLIDIAKKESFHEITLEVSKTNIAAIKLYEKYHFQKLGFRKNYYKDQDAIIMTLYL